MPAIAYNKKNLNLYNFEYKIIHGIKKHTIRKYGLGLKKRPFRIGDTLYHYKNWRTPQVQKITKNKCLWVADIKMYIEKQIFKIKINNKLITGEKLFILSMNDGFSCLEEFKDFFIRAGLPFHGQIIGWTENPGYPGREERNDK